ncbi:DUF4101 domain-containing protein [Pleurocapsales cyanobacterium LEGE 10410]|nr:DUF4101 domain-containing protein [Pleurocapsales cyanobacterium LEGE 10410]
MRIPLDYYRILSVPIKATPEQLEQAKSDRLLQQPRREYSEQAIQARQELIQHSYKILSDPESRAAYDADFLVNMQSLATAIPPEIDETAETAEIAPEVTEDVALPSPNPTIEIPHSQLVGALLILHELGEYELVLRIGIDYFNNQRLQEKQVSQPVSVGQESYRRSPQPEQISGDTAEENIILALALAYLELGREQWHRQEYEHAAVSSQMGINLLQQKDLFPQIKEELESDLYKLRPYRILELISRNSVKTPERAKGFQLLQAMLLQRQGIEGKGEDRSGLSFDQFLCFIQQLRTYLTSAEQQQLFDNDSQRDSAIASYLAVYALLGRGFSLKKPELILRAQRKLERLSEKQDVSWEQTISALLLGHTDKAIDKLKNSQDTTKLKQVQQHSPNSTDLLIDLCFYGEQWLQKEVLTQFPDLKTTRLTLKEYFSDRQVITCLEELPPPTAAVAQTRTASATSSVRPTITKANQQSKVGSTKLGSFWRNLFSTEKTASVKAASSGSTINSEQKLVAPSINHSRNATIRRDRHGVAPPRNSRHKSTPIKGKSLSLPLETKRAVPASVIQKAQGTKKRRKRKLSTATLWKGWLFVLGLILGTGTIGFIGIKLLLNPAAERANEAQLTIAISQPAIELPTKQEQPAAATPELTFAEKSQQTIQTWLDSKSAAFGKEHQIDQLNNILAEPLLRVWRDRAVAYQQGNAYRDYQHQLKLRSAAIDPNNPNKATVEAEVKEVAQHYQSGQLDNAQSYDDNLLVRYQLIRQGEKWLIENSEVLKTL